MSFKYVVKRVLIINFLASTDIKHFGCTYPFAMLLLIGLAFFTPKRSADTSLAEIHEEMIELLDKQVNV